jgi:hypothetical protein
MSTVQRPLGAIVTDLPAASGVVDLSDGEMVRRWAVELREQVDDAIAAGLDATAPPGRRRLGRALAREQIAGAAGSIGRLFAAVGLAAKEVPHGDPARREGDTRGAPSGTTVRRRD